MKAAILPRLWRDGSQERPAKIDGACEISPVRDVIFLEKKTKEKLKSCQGRNRGCVY